MEVTQNKKLKIRDSSKNKCNAKANEKKNGRSDKAKINALYSDVDIINCKETLKKIKLHKKT